MYYDLFSPKYKNLDICNQICNHINTSTNFFCDWQDEDSVSTDQNGNQRNTKDNTLDFWMAHNYSAFANFGYGFIGRNGNILNHSASAIADSIINTINNINLNRSWGEFLTTLSANTIITFKKNVFTALFESDYGAPPPFVKYYIDRAIDKFYVEAKNEWGSDDSLMKEAKSYLEDVILKLKTRQKIVIYISSAHYNKADKNDPNGRYYEYLWSRLFGDLLQATLTKLGFTAIKVFPESLKVNSGDRLNMHKYRGLRAHIINSYFKEKDNRIISIGICPHSNATPTARGASIFTEYYIDDCDLLASCILKYFSTYGILYNGVQYVINNEGQRTTGDTVTVKAFSQTKPTKAKSEFNVERILNLANENINQNASAINYTSLIEATSELQNMIGNSGTTTGNNDPIISILSENFFHDNTEDIKELCSREGNKKLVASHILGIIDFLTKKYIVAGIPYNSAGTPQVRREINNFDIVDNVNANMLTTITQEIIESNFNSLKIATLDDFEKNSYLNNHIINGEVKAIDFIAGNQYDNANTISDNIIRSIISGWGYYEKTRLNGNYGKLGTELPNITTTRTVGGGMGSSTTISQNTNYDGDIDAYNDFISNFATIQNEIRNNLYNAIIY